MVSARGGPGVEPEDSWAEHPFTIKIADPKDKKKKKRRRTENGEEDDTTQNINLQMSPFAPCGKFKTHETMDLFYRVHPAEKWTEMTRYNSFVLNGVKYFNESCVHVANDSSIARQKAIKNDDPLQRRKKSEDDWVARILEIRASDERHVYARVYWMYWPDELPQGTYDGKKTVQGRQPYHGMNELIASNHMDIIDVVSVTSQAQVKQWYEENNEEIQHALYWRQAFDVRTYELSSVELVCRCNTPGNPDNMLLGCTTGSCNKWMYKQYIIDDTLRTTYKFLGTDKPYLPPAITAEEEYSNEGKRPLSPPEIGADGSTKHSIDVEAKAAPSDAIHVGMKDNIEVRQAADGEAASAALEDSLPLRTPEARATSENTVADTTSKPATAGESIPGRKPGTRLERGSKANGENARPWEGLFGATLKMADVGPPLIKFKDEREGVVGGEKMWTERVKCLLCGNQVN